MVLLCKKHSACRAVGRVPVECSALLSISTSAGFCWELSAIMQAGRHDTCTPVYKALCFLVNICTLFTYMVGSRPDS